jgi:hypothetical protein
MELKREDILGLTTDKNELVCNECATDQEWSAVADKSKLFMAANLADTTSLFFCDRCDTRIKV